VVEMEMVRLEVGLVVEMVRLEVGFVVEMVRLEVGFVVEMVRLEVVVEGDRCTKYRQDSSILQMVYPVHLQKCKSD
jgi:hypothetical protein